MRTTRLVIWITRCRHAVRPEAVDQPAVAGLPQEAAEPFGRTDEHPVIELVEVPLVEQELVEAMVARGQFLGRFGRPDVEQYQATTRPITMAINGLSFTQAGTWWNSSSTWLSGSVNNAPFQKSE